DGDRVQPLALFPAQPAARALEGPDPPERLALRLRREHERRRDIRQLPSPKARRSRPPADQDGAPGRVHARSGTPVTVLGGLSLRARLILGVISLAAI